MRRISSAAVIGLLVAMHGCTINVPSNLFNNLIIASTPRPNASVDDLPKKGGPEPAPSEPPIAVKPILPTGFYGFASCDHALGKLDADRDNRLSAGEYAVWAMSLHQPAPCVTPDPAAEANARDRGVMTTPVFQEPPVVSPCEGGAPQPIVPPFEAWDKNRDQFIDRGELCEGGRPASPAPQPRQNGCEETFQRADTNRDFHLSPEEYVTADYAPPPPDGMARPAVMPSEGELMARFKRLDVTGDGKLTPQEFCQDWGTVTVVSPTPAWNDCYGTVKSYDRNQDGKVTWEEYYEGFLLPISARYEGQKDEVHKRFKALDANGDGALAPEEYCLPNSTPAPVDPEPPVMNEPNR
jgi:Ca2+-binding EF-hand superfamily protein